MLSTSIRVLALMLILACSTPAQAQISPAQRKELSALSEKLTEIGSQIRDKNHSAATQGLSDVETRLQAVLAAPGFPASDPLPTRLQNVIARHRTTLEKAGSSPAARGGAEPAKAANGFMQQVAPIIQAKCVSCHGEQNPRNGLRLDTFAGWRRGGRGGALITPGNASRSLIVARLTTTDTRQRMPQGGEALPTAELEAITGWINAGAKFDGADENATLASLINKAEEARLNLTIPRSKGTEQVKFTTDIAPWFTTLCLNCHSANRKSGGLSLESYYDMLKGGDSGPVIVPGDMENSRLFRLVGGLELPRMPANDSRITRKNYDDLRTWFREGNTFDGTDPRASLRTFRAEPEVPVNRFASFTAEQFRQHRLQRTRDQWQRANPNTPLQLVESEDFIVAGDVTADRLAKVRSQCESDLVALRKELPGTAGAWSGRLTVFAFSKRSAYESFVQAVERRRPQSQVRGHFTVSPDLEDAYVAFVDETGSPSTLPPQALLSQQLAGAWLARAGRAWPLWLAEGIGLKFAEGQASDRAVFAETEKAGKALAPTVADPRELFNDAAFSPESRAAVGLSLVKFLEASSSQQQWTSFLNAMSEGQALDAALQSSYRMSSAQLANRFLTSLRR